MQKLLNCSKNQRFYGLSFNNFIVLNFIGLLLICICFIYFVFDSII